MNNSSPIQARFLVQTALLVAMTTFSLLDSTLGQTTTRLSQPLESTAPTLSAQGSEEPQIFNVTHNANKPLSPGEDLRVSVSGTPNSKVMVFLVFLKKEREQVERVRAREVSEGLYEAVYRIGKDDPNAVVIARLHKNQKTRYAAAPLPTQFGPGEVVQGENQKPQPAVSLSPEFLEYSDGDLVNFRDGVVLKAQTQPEATVRVTVVQHTTVLGGLVELGQVTLVNEEVKANHRGSFRVQLPARNYPGGTKFEVRAVARLGDQRSQPTTLILTQQ